MEVEVAATANTRAQILGAPNFVRLMGAFFISVRLWRLTNFLHRLGDQKTRSLKGPATPRRPSQGFRHVFY